MRVRFIFRLNYKIFFTLTILIPQAGNYFITRFNGGYNMVQPDSLNVGYRLILNLLLLSIDYKFSVVF
jgi:hypothetical protein